MKEKVILILSVCVLVILSTSLVDTNLIEVGVGASGIRLVGTESTTIVVPDDFLTIQEAINNAVDGDTIFVRIGTYYEHVVVNKTVSLLGEDVSATIVDGNSTGHVVDVISDNVSVSGFTVQNSGNIHMPDLDAGICLNGTTGCTISENRAVNNGFCGISLLYSDGNIVTNNNLSSPGWGGIHLLSSSRNIVSGNNIADKYGGVNGHVSSNYNNITENTISNCTYGGFFYASSYNNICRNNISTIEVEGIWLQDQVNYNIVAENNFINNTVAISLQGPNYYNTLLRNVITGAEYGIRIQNNARYTRITENVIVNNHAGSDSWSAGIRLDSGGDSQIDFNIIVNNHYGILLYSSSPHVSIYGNNITDNDYAVRVASGGSSYVSISDNFVMNNRGYGIGVTGFGGASNYATISRNLIVNNSEGISLGQSSSFNTIFQNDISQNDHGFYIEYSTQNSIWQNNIVDNNKQVFVSTGSINSWDRGYPSGGNYWSDYTGVDEYSGPDQNVPGSDFRGDIPYNIDSDNMDGYPLVIPYEAGLPTIAILSPENKTYSSDTIPLVFTVDEAIMWMGYNLDSHANATVTGNATLTGLSDGVHSIRVYACDIAGNTASSSMVYFTVTIILDEVDPVADAGQDQTVNVGATVTFDASGSTDNVGIVSCKWDFGDGTSGTGTIVTHEYVNAGSYTVTLTAEDAAGNHATDTLVVTVNPTEAFPIQWLLAAAAIVAVGIIFMVAIIWRRQKKTTR